MVADADLVEWNYTYNTVKGEKVKAFYGILEQYGFQFPNDEEKGVVEGTSSAAWCPTRAWIWCARCSTT